MKIIIAGGRDFTDAEILRKSILKVLVNYFTLYGDIEIVSGGARGVDTMAEEFAKSQHIKFTKFPADWNKHGRSAGHIRNWAMAKYATGGVLIAIWDGKSPGTKGMIHDAKLAKMAIHVFDYNGEKIVI